VDNGLVTEIENTATGLAPSTRAGAGRWAALPMLMAGTLGIVLDFFVGNVALPSIQAAL